MDSSKTFLSYKNSPYRSVKHTTYFYVYDELFEKFRGREITFVEVGVLDGGSLFMWRNYFGEKARIIGVDVNSHAKRWVDYGFEIFIGSQSDESFWEQFRQTVGQVDIFLDDGGHTYEQQILTVEMMIDSVRDGGLLVVEDTHTSYLNGFGYRPLSFVEYVKKRVDRINHRFGELSNQNVDKHIWSIRIFESIVAFEVDRIRAGLESKPTDNGGIKNSSEDQRYLEHYWYSTLNKLYSIKWIRRYIPGARYLLPFFADLSVKLRSIKKTRRFFL